MADNVSITQGSGTTVATDDIGGTHHQKVKVEWGPSDTATQVDTGGSALPIQDGGNSITVDGTVTVQDGGGAVSVDDNGGSLTVDGTVAVSSVGGTVTVDSELTTADLDAGAGTDTRAVVGLVGAKSGGGVLIPGDATKGLAVDLTATGANATALKVDGSAVTQPVSIGSVVHVDDNSGSLTVDDGGGSITVDGTVGISGTVGVTAGNGVTRIQTQSSGLTTSTTAYTAGDQLGAEMTWANAAATSGGTFTIVSATLTDASKLVGSVDLFLFDRTGVTHAGDNAANAWSDADILKCLGVISFPPPVYSANNSIATIPYVGLSCKLNSGETTLYGVAVSRNGHSFFGAATDLAITLTIQKD